MEAKLIGPNGAPLIAEPSLVVLKVVSGQPIHPRVIQIIGQATGCNVAIIPMNSEISMGRVAMEQLDVLFEDICKQKKLAGFNTEELKVIHQGMLLMKQKYGPEPQSPILKILTKIEEALK
jgi:hypothetical protein